MTDSADPPEPPDSLIAYDDIVQDCLRGVVRRVLKDVELAGGLPGGHHFYIAFRTRFPGVDLPRHLLERYPDEMTIVLQHRYWDLAVEEAHFEVGLTFNQVPAKLHVPYAAVTGFHDPAVGFALQFVVPAGEGQAEPVPEPPEPPEDDPGGDAGSNVVSLDFKRKK
jgi:hypothetical protein